MRLLCGNTTSSCAKVFAQTLFGNTTLAAQPEHQFVYHVVPKAPLHPLVLMLIGVQFGRMHLFCCIHHNISCSARLDAHIPFRDYHYHVSNDGLHVAARRCSCLISCQIDLQISARASKNTKNFSDVARQSVIASVL